MRKSHHKNTVQTYALLVNCFFVVIIWLCFVKLFLVLRRSGADNLAVPP